MRPLGDMSSPFCSLEDAFNGPIMGPAKKKKRSKDEVPAAHASAPNTSDPDRQITQLPPPEPLQGPEEPRTMTRLDQGANLQEFFPLPGETAANEEWAKAFSLEPSSGPGVPAPQFSVAGKSTLWRQIPVPAPSPAPASSASERSHSTYSAIPTDVHQRLEILTKQLESLTSPSPAQSTAELFLFVAIGLLLLLAIDTLLRFATAVATGAKKALRGGARLRVRGRRFR